MTSTNENQVMDWRNQSQCQRELNIYAQHILNDDVRYHIVENNTDYCYSDNMSFLPSETIVEQFINLFREYYISVKVFHGCRPVSLKPYYQKGIIGQNLEFIENKFVEIFSDIDEEILNKAIMDAKEKDYSEEGNIYFVCDDEELINDCGHYLIQGSEYLQGLAARLMRGRPYGVDHRRRLREYGVPTIMEVHLPVSFIPYYQLKELSQTLIADWGNRLLDVKENYDPIMGFMINKPIEPIHIMAHYHPKEIIDPHNQMLTYRPQIISCDMCTN